MRVLKDERELAICELDVWTMTTVMLFRPSCDHGTLSPYLWRFVYGIYVLLYLYSVDTIY